MLEQPIGMGCSPATAWPIIRDCCRAGYVPRDRIQMLRLCVPNAPSHGENTSSILVGSAKKSST